ncbi:MAG: hypothetical protein COC19_05730 [SAR86 cluster bacterium]|uniref:diguanylate cyclase n=1 Tax=SAR86 cluster bacterium TaxID=2030880 RepID=A0A2A4MK56_9GAMM|nr:MAG: hypothetical protein COC19_05730 [SAR86 cluster bacterium]
MILAKAVLDSMAMVTGHTQESLLGESLVLSISQLFDIDVVQLIYFKQVNKKVIINIAASQGRELERNETDESLAESNENLIYKQFESLVKDCKKSRKLKIQFRKPFTYCVFPFYQNRGVDFLLCLKTKTWSERSTGIVDGMLQIYKNYLSSLAESGVDKLTGLLNRKYFHEEINKSILYSRVNKALDTIELERRGNQKNNSYWLGILDIDFFKKINDDHGHLYGDEVLILFSNLMRENFREHDLLFRYGGEEFAAVIGPLDDEQAVAAFERFRERVSHLSLHKVKHLSVSAGLVKIDKYDSPINIVGHADQALYYAKENGRDQIAIFSELISRGLIQKPVETEEPLLF